MSTPKHLFAQTRKTPNNSMLVTHLHHYAGVQARSPAYAL